MFVCVEIGTKSIFLSVKRLLQSNIHTYFSTYTHNIGTYNKVSLHIQFYMALYLSICGPFDMKIDNNNGSPLKAKYE